MQRIMVTIAIELTGYASLRYIQVSLPLVVQLLDGEKYMLPGEAPKPESRDWRRIRQGKVRAPRAPTLKAMVRLAARCEDAAELGERLLKRYGRTETRREAAELDARLDRLLAQD
jgi:hypothetical protein